MQSEEEQTEEIPKPSVRGLRRRTGSWEVQIEGLEGSHVATDVSEGGLFVAGEEQHPPGTQCIATLTIAPERLLSLPCVVRWSRTNALSEAVREGMGLEFLELEDDVREAVNALVNG